MKPAWLLILVLIVNPALPAAGAWLAQPVSADQACPLMCCEADTAGEMNMPWCGCAVSAPTDPGQLPPALPGRASNLGEMTASAVASSFFAPWRAPVDFSVRLGACTPAASTGPVDRQADLCRWLN